MKSLAAAACLLLAASLMQAETPVSTNKVTATNAPDLKAAKATVIKKDDKKKDDPKKEEEPKIPGTVIARANGTFLGLEVVGGNFRLSFYDKKKKAMAVDVTRATARWPNPKAPGDNRTVLNVSGTTLVGQKPVVPPLNFNVYLTLLVGEGDEAKAVENYTVAYRG